MTLPFTTPRRFIPAHEEIEMVRPVIIAVAITGSIPRKKDTPAIPVTPAEQIESTHEAFEAGAALVHVHVRNRDESSGSDPALFAQVQEGMRKHCPNMIIQFSTGEQGSSSGYAPPEGSRSVGAPDGGRPRRSRGLSCGLTNALGQTDYQLRPFIARRLRDLRIRGG
jgi:hypothetical protein